MMNDASIVAEYLDLVRIAKNKNMWIEVDEYTGQFHVLDFTEKPAKKVGVCSSLGELTSIIVDAWQDEHGNWVAHNGIQINEAHKARSVEAER
jgi:hypothetical protein